MSPSNYSSNPHLSSSSSSSSLFFFKTLKSQTLRQILQNMSTDLQLPNNLPSLRLNLVKTKLADESCTLQTENPDLELEECQTPTSSEHKIPEMMTCPPAPKKHRIYVPSCKRRISEFELFEYVARDQIESFFKSSYEIIDQNSINNKRRCRNL